MIKTVLGNTEDLGKVYMHEHLYADLSTVRDDGDSILTNIEDIITELKPVCDLGIKTFVDVSCIGMGRDVNKLKEISERLNCNIVCSTGFYLPAYYPTYIHEKTYIELGEIFINELTKGIDNTNICAGIIGEIATEKNKFDDINKKIFKAAAYAHRKTGAPITTHASAGTMGFEQAKFLIEQGVERSKIVIGHMDLMKDIDEIEKVLKLGVNVGFDTIGKNAYVPNETRIKNFITLINKGYENQIVLSVDISRKSYYKHFGGHGYTYLITDFINNVIECGISEKTIDTILINNPKKILDIKEENILIHNTSQRVQILVDYDSIVPQSVRVGNKFIQYVNQCNKINNSHDNYEMFETHLMMASNRIAIGDALTEIPEEISLEIDNKWFTDLAIKALQFACKEEFLPYSDVEAKYLALHLGVLLEKEQ